MGRSFPIDGAVRLAVTTALLLPLASCAEFNTVADVVFPASVPGLPSDQSWTSLPIRRWLTEPGIAPIAISACFAHACRDPAVAGLFRAEGPRADALRRAARDPQVLLAEISRGASPGARLRAKAAGGRQVRARVSAEAAREGGRPGYLIRIARPDGRHGAAGYVATSERGGTVTALVIVAANEASARTLARGVVPNLPE